MYVCMYGMYVRMYVAYVRVCTHATYSDWSVDSKISLFIALAPVGYIYRTPSVLLKALSLVHMDALVQLFQVHEFLPTSRMLQFLLPAVCAATPIVCESVIYLIAGIDLGNNISARFPSISFPFFLCCLLPLMTCRSSCLCFPLLVSSFLLFLHHHIISFFLSFCLSVCLSVYLSVCLPVCLYRRYRYREHER